MPIAIFGFTSDHQPHVIYTEDEFVDYWRRRLVHKFEGSPPVPGDMRPREHDTEQDFTTRVAERLVWFRTLIGRPLIMGNPYKCFIIVTPLNSGPKRETLRCWDHQCMDKPEPERWFRDYYKKGDEWYTEGHYFSTVVTDRALIDLLEGLLAAEKENNLI